MFWLSDPSVLLKPEFIPNNTMTKTEKLNTLTRLLIIGSLILFAVDYKEWYIILLAGLLIIIICYNSQKEYFDCTDIKNAAYEFEPLDRYNNDDWSKRSYANAQYELNPMVDELHYKWQREPEDVGSFTMTPPVTTLVDENPDASPSSVNYIVRSKIDFLDIDMSNRCLNNVRQDAEDAFLQNELLQRNTIMNDYVDRFRRERQNNCSDTPVMRLSAGGGGTI